MLKPLDNYVVLEEKNITTLDNGVIVDDKIMDKPNIGTIVSVGDQVTKVKASDQVIFKYHLFDELTLEGKKYLIGKDEGVIALV